MAEEMLEGLSQIVKPFKLVPFVGKFGGVLLFIQRIHGTRPKVHKERVRRLKCRLKVLEEQLRSMEGSEEEPAHLQQTCQNLEEVLEETLEMLTNLEDLSWVQRFLTKGYVDSKFERLNRNLTDHTQSLMLSLNIDSHTFNLDRIRMEDEVDRTADLKYLEGLKDTLQSLKYDTLEIKDNIKKMMLGSSKSDTQQEEENESYEDATLQKAKKQYQAKMIDIFGHIRECTEEGRSKKLLSKIYIELHITEGESEGVNTQHEVHKIGKQSRKNKSKINCNDIFETSVDHEKVRIVMTTGIAGIGKTVCVRKFILDWAEGRANQDVHFVLSLPLRQLNLIQNESYSLHSLLLHLHPELEEVMKPNMLARLKIVLIFDGLDESKLPLNIQHNKEIYDPLKIVSLDVLITNLVKGNLLPKSLIWITTRPAAIKRVPSSIINKWTEVQGFNDQQKEEYFRKKIEDQTKAERAITHIKRSRSLYIMCHIPVFCWMLATTCLNISDQTTQLLPQTLTEMYVYFLLTEMKRKNQKNARDCGTDIKHILESERKAILKLSELAFKELEKGNILFDEHNLRECGIDVEDISVYSGMCTEFFQTETYFSKRKVFCFVHLSIQEFLAAFFAFHSFVNKNTAGINILTSPRGDLAMQEPASMNRQPKPLKTIQGRLLGWCKRKSKSSFELSMVDFLQTAVDKSIQSEDGHMDLFLRFLLGISLETNQKLLEGFLKHTQSSSDCLKETAQHIKGILSEDTKVPERCVNLLLCLLEMKNNSLHQEIQQYMTSGQWLSPAQCSRLAYMLLASEETLEEFDLTKYNTTSEGQKRLLVALRVCRRARLAGCDLKSDSLEVLTSVIQSENSLLRKLDLSCIPLGDSGVLRLSLGLKHRNCQLETLRFADCNLTDKSCEIVALVLQYPNSLLQLDLSTNGLGDSGVQLLCKGLSSPNCNLQTLRFADCKLTDKSCEAVASALQSPNFLIRLNISNNDLGDSGAELLLKGLASPNCKLQTLILADCKLTDVTCENVASVLQSPNTLIQLDLSDNNFGDTGVQLLLKGLLTSHCKLEILTLADCKLTHKPCEIVSSVLQSPTSLLQLNFSTNDLGDSGVRLLSKGLSSPYCKIQTLRLADCNLTDKSCAIMASVLQSPNSLLQLDMSHNDLGDSGVQFLSKGLSSLHCKLHTLRLSDCLIEKGCIHLASALTANPSHLRELDLNYNHPEESVLKLLSASRQDPTCKLETLKTDHVSLNRARPRLLRYACDLTLDPNTAHRYLSLTERNRMVTHVLDEQPYPDHPERFDVYSQVLCKEGLSGRCYWEAEWSGAGAEIAVAYKSIRRKGEDHDCWLGRNDKSWNLDCSHDSYTARHNNEHTKILTPSPGSRRVGVYLDWPGGTLSFYGVFCRTLTHLHTFHSTFTEPLYPGIWPYSFGSSVSLCQMT